MAYNLRYKLKALAKSGYLITVNIQEKDFVGDYENMDLCSQPFKMNGIAQSDDVYLPILSSELIIRADITNFRGTLPDFTTNDDRKYWVEVRATKDSDDFLMWQGFILTDNVQLNFSTGFQELVFSCTDGFAMLKNIPYEPTDRDINVLESLTNTILNCFNKLQLPYSFYLNVCTSTFANGMNDRGDSPIYEPLGQTYYAPRNFLNGVATPVEGVTSTSNYMSCYDVLSQIATSWGCQIKQSQGEYYISNRAEEAEETIYYTKYLDDGSIAGSGLLGFRRNVVAWSHIANYFFIDNQQRKILRKGFPDLQFKCPATYAPQMVDNGDMAVLDSGSITGLANWSKGLTGSVTLTSLGPYNALNLHPTDGGPNRIARAFPTSKAPVYQGDKINFSFWIDGQATPSPTVPKVWFEVILTGPAPSFTQYWLNSDSNWVEVIFPAATGKYNVIGNTSGTYETITITTPPAPISGTLSLQFICDNYDTEVCTFANFIVTYQSPWDYRLIQNGNTDPSYQKLVEVSMGGPCTEYNPTQVGSLLKSDGTVWDAWYRYGQSESFQELMALVYKQYYNIVTTSSINMEGNIRKILPGSSIIPNQQMTSFTIADSTGTISVSAKKYLIGNSSFDFIDDSLQNVTLLETSNTDLAITGYSDRTIPKQ